MLGQPTFPTNLVMFSQKKISRGLVHKFYEGVVVHLMEVLVPNLNDTKRDLAHHDTTWNKRVAISKKTINNSKKW